MSVLPHLASRLFNTPLMIARAKLETILAVLRPKLLGETLPASDGSAADDYTVTPGGIAVIPIFGTLVRRSYGMMAQSGLTSYADISAQFDDALSDPDVQAIVLDIDSPGGDAGGVFDLAQQIYAARGSKPIWAVADEEAFSSAYLIASAADQIYLPQTGGVGSIGVIAMHVDQSQADQDDGLVYTSVYAGDHKNDFSPHAPLSDPARAALQAEVERIYGMFVSNVAKMRGMTSDAVTATEAGLYFGENAITAGLADHIGTLSDALNDLGARISGAASRFILNPQPKEFNMKDNHPATETQGAGLPAPDKADPAKPDSGKPAASTPDLAAIRAEAAATAQKQAFAYVTEVTELCQLAGHPEKAAAFIASTVPIEGVRQALLAARAAEANASAIAGHVPVNNGVTAEPKIDTAAIYANRNQKKG